MWDNWDMQRSGQFKMQNTNICVLFANRNYKLFYSMRVNCSGTEGLKLQYDPLASTIQLLFSGTEKINQTHP